MKYNVGDLFVSNREIEPAIGYIVTISDYDDCPMIKVKWRMNNSGVNYANYYSEENIAKWLEDGTMKYYPVKL